MMHIPESYMFRWEINSDCNLSCLHCCNADTASIKRGPALTKAQIVQALQRLSKEGLKRIHFLGGEPLVRKDFLDICHKCIENGIEVSFNTNALLLNDSNLLKQVLSIPFSSITISIDGVDAQSHDFIRGHGTFNLVVNAVKNIVKQRTIRETEYPHIVIQSTLTRLWSQKVPDLFFLAEKLGASGIVINNLAIEGRAKQYSRELALTGNEEFQAAGVILRCMYEHPNLIVRSPFRSMVAHHFRKIYDINLPGIIFSCSGVLNMAYILPDGKVIPCIVAEIQGMGKAFEDLNILTDNTTSIWNSEYFKLFYDIVHGPIDRTYAKLSPCNRCAFLGNLCKPCPLSLTNSNEATITPCEIAFHDISTPQNEVAHVSSN